MTMTRDKIEALPELPKGWPNSHPYSYTSDDMHKYALLALAERALEPQGQTLPDDGELSLDQLMKVFDMGLGFALCHRDFLDTRNAIKKLQADFKVIQQRASQLALPAGPVPEDQAEHRAALQYPGMVDDVIWQLDKAKSLSSGGEQCFRARDVLLFARAVEFEVLARCRVPSPAVAQPVDGFKTQPTAEQVATVRERLEAAGLQKVAQPVADEREGGAQ